MNLKGAQTALDSWSPVTTVAQEKEREQWAGVVRESFMEEGGLNERWDSDPQAGPSRWKEQQEQSTDVGMDKTDQWGCREARGGGNGKEGKDSTEGLLE